MRQSVFTGFKPFVFSEGPVPADKSVWPSQPQVAVVVPVYGKEQVFFVAACNFPDGITIVAVAGLFYGYAVVCPEPKVGFTVFENGPYNIVLQWIWIIGAFSFTGKISRSGRFNIQSVVRPDPKRSVFIV